jgi:3-hydroxymyristoyl/3-hydroxydecanoyl-(acyl carrier protein) dehydratase
VTGDEIQFFKHFPELAIMPGTLIVEAIGQAASILFSNTTSLGMRSGEFLVLGIINKMRPGVGVARRSNGYRRAMKRI